MSYKALSWGVGVQSTTLAVMSALGDLEPLDVVISADTQNERDETYRMRDWYTKWLTERGLQVEIVTAGNILEQGANAHIHIPFWTSDGGPLRRQCTRQFKINPVKRRLRQLIGFHESEPPHPKPGAIEQWLGISWDEWTRMKHSRVKFLRTRWPLIERRMTRNDCIEYLQKKELPIPPNSACKICPYRQASAWLEMEPAELEETIKFDESNRHNPLAIDGSQADELYIWKGLIPLSEVDFQTETAKERQAKQLPLMICESGYCWV